MPLPLKERTSNLPVTRISFSSPTKAGGKEDKVGPLLLSQTKKSPTQDEESEDMDVIPVKQLFYISVNMRKADFLVRNKRQTMM